MQFGPSLNPACISTGEARHVASCCIRYKSCSVETWAQSGCL